MINTSIRVIHHTISQTYFELFIIPKSRIDLYRDGRCRSTEHRQTPAVSSVHTESSPSGFHCFSVITDTDALEHRWPLHHRPLMHWYSRCHWWCQGHWPHWHINANLHRLYSISGISWHLSDKTSNARRDYSLDPRLNLMYLSSIPSR